MKTNSLLAGLLLAAGATLAAAPQALAADTCTPARQTITAPVAATPGFAIDQDGTLHCGQLADQSHAPFNWNCVC